MSVLEFYASCIQQNIPCKYKKNGPGNCGISRQEGDEMGGGGGYSKDSK